MWGQGNHGASTSPKVSSSPAYRHNGKALDANSVAIHMEREDDNQRIGALDVI
jgi:hypothetical protein